MLSKVSPQHGFYALGGFCFSLGVQHALFEGRGLETVLESFIIWCLSVLVLFTAYTVSTRNISHNGRWRALVLGIGFTIAFVVLAIAVWLTWSIRGPPREFSFLISFAATLGAVVGTRSGLYAVENQERLEEARELSKLLRINQRVLRHNIRNELSIALGYLGRLETVERTEEIPETTRIIRRHLQDLLEAADRTQRIVSIWETETRRECDLTEVVRTQVAHVREEYPELTLTTELPGSCHVRAHPALPLAIEEAVENAIEHNTSEVTVSVSIRTQDDGTVILEITDTGKGIPEDDWKAIELPEETPLIHTEGLGLWIIYWVMNMSGGAVEFAENEPQGAIVRLVFPPESSLLTMPRRDGFFIWNDDSR